MRNLVEQIEVKISEKNQLETYREKNLSATGKANKNIQLAHKTIVEKIIEIISFGFIKYNEKYNNIVEKNQHLVAKSKQEISQINKNIKFINVEINELKENLKDKLNKFKAELVEFQDKLLSFTSGRYIDTYTKVELIDKLKNIILNQEEFLLDKNIQPFIADIILFSQTPKQWIDSKNKIFIANEKVVEKDFFDTIESNPLKEKQKDAVLVNENNNLILAGAGSGKTSVIIAKVAYLIKKNIVHPNAILVLVFNKNAKKELEDRFEKKDIHIKVKTFHSFGLSVIAEAISQKPDLCPMTESPVNMTKFIKDTICKLLSSMGEFLKNFIDFIAYFGVPYKNESEFESLGEYYDYQKSYDMKTLKHKVAIKGEKQGECLTTLKEETVKSYQELVIANFLTLNGIKYLYEEPYKYKTKTVERRQYKPDFYLPDFDVYIEHFGIDRDGNTAPYINKQEYLEGMEWKIQKHKECETNLVQTFSYEFTEDLLLISLKEKLLKCNVIFREISSAEIHELLKEEVEGNKFTKLFTTFLRHYKSNMFSFDEIKQKSVKTKSQRTILFIKLFKFIFTEYEKFQDKNDCIDFDDMIVKAVNLIESGGYTHQFKHIFIDEFQDISTTRMLLIEKLLPMNNTSVTAVGDDWQAINAFAGSNIKIIQDFTRKFGASQAIELDYTFRFDNVISDIASDFIQKNPYQIKKKIKTIKKQDSSKFSLLLYWKTGDIKFDLTKIIDLIAKKESSAEILILARYNFLLTELKGVFKGKYPNFDIRFSSVHGSKGNEADYVIVLNLDKGRFGFPSKIEDDPILNLVIPESNEFEDAEERRLFYVALTRTKKRIFLLSNECNKSTFIEEIIENYKDDIFFLNDSKIKLINCPECKTGLLTKREQGKNTNKHFYGCSNFPRCKYTENVQYCPECNKEVFRSEGNKSAKCSNSNCDFEAELCVKCSGYMVKRPGKYGQFLGCTNYPKCNHKSKINESNITTIDDIF
ncbi:UvrD-helicase domain-containing protein [Bathymodiolus thermophilus thioautotrophic gill symbiont]|uniref:DNA 3'-5' helicase n=1 Tax=Bathymodiolus thermophilus thioautotrophic gill symbiont TaxID=2360 RepID=A0A1J5UHT5_9GAMM|nr:UvrD-helicase domain-containing protein [Bathymodiolus thermophilus thioautotrophic gill symbiont]OIR25461.1 hypothetical protein BGC33_13420 [Bathymodiolus thermophilus thioautotrophic gill symbiont]